MLHPNGEIRGKNLTVFDQELKAELKRFNERQASEPKAQQNRKPNNSLKTIATLIVTQFVRK